MSDLTPRQPKRPLQWPDSVFDLRDLLSDVPQPVYIVGGAVRDAFMSRPVKDLDLATPDDSIGLARTIANRMKGDIFVMDVERGVARVLVDTPEGRLTMDIARFRGDDLAADLADRDFTVNAIAVDLHGDLELLIDPLNSEQDILDRVLRRCSPTSISTDPIRALRAVRQSVQLGMRIEPQTVKDVRTYGARLLETSPERVRDEFFNLLNISKPSSGLRIAHQLGLLQQIVPETSVEALQWQHTLLIIEYLAALFTAISPARTDQTAATFQLGMVVIQLDRYRAKLQKHLDATWANGRTHQALLVLAVLLHSTDATFSAVESRADELRLSNPEKTRLRIAGRKLLLPESLDSRIIYRFWRDLGESGIDVCLLGLATYLGTAQTMLSQDEWLEIVERVLRLVDAYYTQYEASVATPPLLDGNQLMDALKLKPGPRVGQLLEFIREEQAVGNIKSVEDALQLAHQHSNGKI